jgi:hypothetical protein
MGQIKVAGAVAQIGTTASDMQQPGALRRETDGKVYRLCKCGATIASVGAAAFVQLDSESGTDGYTVEKLTASTVPLFGINKTGAAIATGEYFWLQVGGACAVDSDMTTGNLGANAPVYLGNLGMTSSPVTNQRAIGHTPVAFASTATGIVYLDCWGNQ